jgi:hypothetical protein
MSLAYLPEHADEARHALDLAEREAAHLAYTARTLFSADIDPQWVREIAANEERAEKIDAFVSRFGRLQDHIGEKLIPRFARLLGETPRSLLDTLAYAERMGWLDSADEFIGARRLRNQLIHEYLTNPELFLEALKAGEEASYLLIDIVRRMRSEASRLQLPG